MNRVPSTRRPFEAKSFYIFPRATTNNNSASQSSSPKRNELPLIKKKSQRRRLISISTSDGKWQGSWNRDYNFSLRDLHLQELAQDIHQDAQVSVTLCIHKALVSLWMVGSWHPLPANASTVPLLSAERKSTEGPKVAHNPHLLERPKLIEFKVDDEKWQKLLYSEELNMIDANFNVWVLPSRPKASAEELPLLGFEDPSVIYVKPGHEANLDSLVQDTVRLATSVKETCSESCEKSEPKLQSLDKQNAGSVNRRWSILLELKNAGL